MNNLSTVRLAISVLTVITAAIHALLAATAGIMFYLNAAGYMVLLAALLKKPAMLAKFVEGREKLLHYAFMAYAGVTIVGYFAMNGGGSFSNLAGLATKLDELLLIGALWQHLRLTRPA